MQWVQGSLMRYFFVMIFSVITLFISSVLASDNELSLESAANTSQSVALQLTEQELAWIEENRSVTMIGDADWLPFEGFDKAGRYIGIVAETLNLITFKTGLAFNVKKTATWQHSLQFSEDHRVDIISASESNPVLERNYRATYSTMKSPIVMIASNETRYISDLSAANGLRVALIGSAGYNSQIIENYPEVNFVYIEEINEGLLGVAEDHYDLVLMSMMVASYKMAELGLYELRVAGITDLDMELTLFVNRNKPILWSIIDKVKRAETKQEHHKLLSKWAQDNSVQPYSAEMVRMGIAVALFLIACSFYRNYLLKKQAKVLIALTQTDKLTKTYHRLYVDQIVTQKIQQKKAALSLIMVDIDNLKRVNEKHGYLVGDKLLQQFSLLMKDHLDKNNAIGRWSAGQFVIICPGQNEQQAQILVEKLSAEVVQTIFLGVGKKSASFAVVQYQSPESAETFLGRADRALYDAKERLHREG